MCIGKKDNIRNKTGLDDITKQTRNIINRRFYGRAVYLLIIIFISTSLIGCSKDIKEPPPLKLRVSILPDESREKLLERYTPLFEYLSKEIGIPYELIFPKNYKESLELFHAKKVDLAYFGGYTFVKANISDNAVPLVMRDVDKKFTSYFIVKGDDPAQKLRDFKGRSFSFGSRLSTSGHLMPRYFLNKIGIVPEDFFSDVLYSGSHDITAYWVSDRKVELGVSNPFVINKMYTDGRLDNKEVRVLWETPPYPNYVWAVRPQINNALKTKLRKAFLSLSKTNRDHKKILEGVDAGGFVRTSVKDFSNLRRIIYKLKLL